MADWSVGRIPWTRHLALGMWGTYIAASDHVEHWDEPEEYDVGAWHYDASEPVWTVRYPGGLFAFFEWLHGNGRWELTGKLLPRG